MATYALVAGAIVEEDVVPVLSDRLIFMDEAVELLRPCEVVEVVVVDMDPVRLLGNCPG